MYNLIFYIQNSIHLNIGFFSSMFSLFLYTDLYVFILQLFLLSY